MFRDMVMRPRKGDFAFCLIGELLLWFSFCFLCSGEQHQQTRTQRKKFASLFKAAGFLRAIEGFDFNLVRLVALARAKLRKQQSKIRPHKEKKKQTVTTQNAQSRKSKKPHAEKETVDPLFYTAKERSVDHLPCMRH